MKTRQPPTEPRETQPSAGVLCCCYPVPTCAVQCCFLPVRMHCTVLLPYRHPFQHTCTAVTPAMYGRFSVRTRLLYTT